MAQKSLPNLNKVNTSMIWYSTFYTKHYQWLSSQSLYFLYFFNKLTVYLDMFFINLFWIHFEKTSLFYGFKKITIFSKRETRFFKPVTSYLVNTSKTNLIFNIFYKTNLQRFKKDVSVEDHDLLRYKFHDRNINNLNKIFYFNML